MLVQQILKSKEKQGVITVKPESSVAEAAAILSRNRIGSVVVSCTGKTVDGILSERDIVCELGKRGAGCLTDMVKNMMTKSPVTCGFDQTADEILQKMTVGRFRHMPVIQGGELIGIITIGDAVKARLSELSMEKEALEGMIMGH